MKKASFVAVGVLLVLLSGGMGGCAAYRPLQIEPMAKTAKAFKKKKLLASGGEVIQPKFANSYYYYDRDGTLFFVMRSHTADKETGKPVDQVMTVRVFWRPVGGKTSMTVTSLNATIRYVLMTPDTVAMYEGAGFVRLWGKSGRAILKARVMDGDLRLTQSSAAFVDNLGRARIRGNIKATYDDVRALDMLMGAHREFFARSLLSKPAPAATEPGEPRDDGDMTAPEPDTQPETQPGDVTPPGGNGQ